MTYQETLDFLFSQLPAYHRIGKAAYKDNLDNSIILDNYFGNPHRNFLNIHVAGTNGKGSVSHMLASVLQEAGYKTGLYTSPHLLDFRERIKVDGKMISKEEIVTFVTKHHEILKSVNPSFFEMTVAMAFDYFSRCKVDIAVIEVGLGGRLDSTNIISPVLSVITNIGHDHMDLLGDSLSKIAAEKAGIIKYSVPVVIGETHPETRDIFLQRASATVSDIEFADVNFSCSLGESDYVTRMRKFLINDKLLNITMQGSTPLGGDYQLKNLVCLFQVIKSLSKQIKLSDENLLSGIKNVITNTGLTGRWQVLNSNPLTICDTGHNKEGLEFVINQIHNTPRERLHMIIGFVNDKDLSSVLPLFPKDAIYYFTKASVPRALDENILMRKCNEYDLHGESYTNVKLARQEAEKAASGNDLIFIGGSTFVVADAL